VSASSSSIDGLCTLSMVVEDAAEAGGGMATDADVEEATDATVDVFVVGRDAAGAVVVTAALFETGVNSSRLHTSRLNKE